ncbi:hypothetical protein [Opitutus sp. ER46]|uniref:YciI family protein n=1 Tax=Opitutus sp. ER46 TaxID=2161864 RepID=UPI0011B23114|nr:hypothetical protein [Opitutus sp. ER46]
MSSFVVLFRQGPHPLTEVDRQRRQAAVSAWAKPLNAAGHKLEPRILAPDARYAGPTPPGQPAGWPVTALLFLEAASLDEAERIAASHPATAYNASVEVRPWTPPPVPAASSR